MEGVGDKACEDNREVAVEEVEATSFVDETGIELFVSVVVLPTIEDNDY